MQVSSITIATVTGTSVESTESFESELFDGTMSHSMGCLTGKKTLRTQKADKEIIPAISDTAAMIHPPSCQASILVNRPTFFEPTQAFR